MLSVGTEYLIVISRSVWQPGKFIFVRNTFQRKTWSIPVSLHIYFLFQKCYANIYHVSLYNHVG